MVLALLGAFKRRKQTLLLNTHFQAANFWVIEAPCHVQEAHWTRVVGLTGNLFSLTTPNGASTFPLP